MAQHDYRNPDDYRGDRQRGPGQMDQYADSQRQHGGQPYRGREDYARGDAANWGARARRDEGLEHADAAQAGYGRYGAPDIHGQPSGGYARPVYEPARQGYGQYERRGEEDPRFQHDGGRYGNPGGYAPWNQERGGRDDFQASERYGRGYGYDDGRHRYQGGTGGYRSNAGPYAGSQTYGGYGDQLGYGSGPGYGGGHGTHHDPDYQQWREQQLRKLDEDYESWRGERYKKFSDEFGEWRKNQAQQQGTAGSGGQDKAQRGGGSASIGTGQGGGSGSK